MEFDADLPKTLLDQRESGKKLALITNSDWEYTKVMMHHVRSADVPVHFVIVFLMHVHVRTTKS